MKCVVEMTEQELKEMLSKVTMKKFNLPIKELKMVNDTLVMELDDTKPTQSNVKTGE